MTFKRALALVAVVTACALTLSACPNPSGGSHRTPPTVQIHQ